MIGMKSGTALFLTVLVLLASCSAKIQSKGETMKESARWDCEVKSDLTVKDDCYHARAHQTNNRTLCDQILDDEKKEHCYEHVPH